MKITPDSPLGKKLIAQGRLKPSDFERGGEPSKAREGRIKGVKRKVVDGINFASTKEANRYEQLQLLRRNGAVRFFLMQVPFRLPGNVKYLLDFMIFWSDGQVTFEDCKGMITDVYRIKKKQVEDLYPITIEET